MEDNTILTINNLNKNYIKDKKEIKVLENLSCEFATGKLYAITGKSGSGKSTLLKCIAALTKINSGSIYYLNKDISHYTEKELASFRNKNIGIVFQEYNLLNFINVYENILTPLVISGETNYKDKNNEKVNSMIKYVGLEERSDHFPNELSGGEEQRVAIARALVNNPDIILADEPTVSIDSENAKNILDLFKKISKNKCVIVVTHDEKVLEYADVIYRLEDGSIKKHE